VVVSTSPSRWACSGPKTVAPRAAVVGDPVRYAALSSVVVREAASWSMGGGRSSEPVGVKTSSIVPSGSMK
jgi:hypothetical protein